MVTHSNKPAPKKKRGQPVVKVLRELGLPLMIGAVCILLLIQCVGFQWKADALEKQFKAEKVAGEAEVKVAVMKTTKNVTEKVTKEIEEKHDETLQKSYKLLETVRNLKMTISHLEEIGAIVGAGNGGSSNGRTPGLGPENEGSIPSPPTTGGNTPEMDGKRISWCLDQAIANEKRSKRAAQANAYLAGSPMAGLGECIVANADRTGVNFALCPAIAQAESTKGRVCPSFNAWGMGPGMTFSSWEQGVARWFDNTLQRWGPAQRAEEFVNPDYCVPPYPWIPNVQGQVDYIIGIQP